MHRRVYLSQMDLKAEDVPRTPVVALFWLPDDDKPSYRLQFGHEVIGDQDYRRQLKNECLTVPAGLSC